MKRKRGRAKSLPLSTRKGQPSSRNMTTRRAASKAATNSSGGSTTSADSRRSSLDDSTHVVGGDDIDSYRPAKKARRTSTATDSRPLTRRQKTGSQEPIENTEKSSRESVVPDPPRIAESENKDDKIDPFVMNGDYNGFASEAGEKLSPLPKRRGRKPKLKTVTASTSRMQELVASWDQENGTDREASNAPSRATSRAPSRAPDRVAKRMPGRRRAPHADPNIEADLRRQLQLRLAYRSVAKALKPLLAELSQRSIDALEDDEGAHQQGEEYTAVMTELDTRLQSRLEVLENERRIKTDSRHEWLELQKEELRLRFVNRVEVLQDNCQTQAENRLLKLYREYEREIDDDATEDEDGVVGPQHGKTSNANPTGRLDHKFDSRSRFFLLTEKLADGRQRQLEMQKLQKDFVAEDHDASQEEIEVRDENEYPSGFGHASTARRDYATSVLNLRALALASETVEKDDERTERAAKIIPNEDAIGLQVLANVMNLQPLVVHPARILSRMQTPPPPVLVKKEPESIELTGFGRGDVIDLTTSQKLVEQNQETVLEAEQRSVIALTSPQMAIKVEQNTVPHAVVSPTKKKHQRKLSQLLSFPSPKTQKPAVAAPPVFQIPGLQAPEELQQPRQPALRMQDITPSSAVPFWVSDAPQYFQNGNASTSVKEKHRSPKYSDRRLDTRSAQPPAGTSRPEPTPPFAFTDARHSPAPAASASRWENLYKQTRQGSRSDAENGKHHDSQARFTHDRHLSESVRPVASQPSDANQANTAAHRRNISIPARVSSPVSFLRRSHSPRVPDPGHRAPIGYINPLITDLGPTTQRTGSPSSGSQSAIEPSQRKWADHPAPGSWQGGQHRHSHSTSRNFTPPPPNHRRTPPDPYPPASGPAYQNQSPYTAGPSYQPHQPPPQGHYSGPYPGAPPQYQHPLPASAPQYDYRPPNSFLPPQQQSYAGGPPYQPHPPLGYFSGPPPGPLPPPSAVFSPRFGQYPPSPAGQYGSGQPPPSPQSAGPPAPRDGSAHGRSDSWAQRR